MARSFLPTSLRQQRRHRVSLLITLLAMSSLLTIASAHFQGIPASTRTPRSYLPFLAQTGATSTRTPTPFATAIISPTNTATATSTSTVTPNPTATVIATVTPSTTVHLGISGTVAVRPQWITIVNGQCVPAGGTDWLDYIDSAHLPPVPPAPAFDTFGYVYIHTTPTSPSTPVYTLPISTDPSSGTLVFTLPANAGLTAGIYYVEAYIDYKGDDGVTRQYDGLVDLATQQVTSRAPFEVVVPNNGGTNITWSLFLGFPPSAQVCPSKG